MTFARFAITASLMCAAASPLRAAESFAGRWGMDAAACTNWSGATAANSPLIVSDNAIRWYDGACRVARMYKTGNVVRMEARCWRDGEDRSTPVSLETIGDRLKASWNRGPANTLKRCP
ncbi:MAG: hypothetical protein WCI56_07845 [Hyphomicrobiales bacterium]